MLISKRFTTFVPAFCLLLTASATSAETGGDRGLNVEPLTTERVASGLLRPVFATHAPGDYDRLYIIEKAGVIKVLNLRTGVVNATPFLDIDSLVGGGGSNNDERGLLGLAFHPNYQENGLFFVDHTDNSGDTVIAKYSVTSPDLADAASRDIILTVDQPFSNHNGGWLGFGPSDGYLYISFGDGGSAGDPGGRGQDITDQLLGKLLRLDVDGDDFPGDPNRDYAIPADNPFVDITGDDEIWAYGLRNPWRPSFDRETHDLWIADVGQGLWEEVDFQPAASIGGENYGWRCYEGNHAYNLSDCDPPETMVFPVYEYSHGGSPFRCSITGGYVYRGCKIPTLRGHYFFADFCSNQIWTFLLDADGEVTQFEDRTVELDPPGASITDITSFGEDARGELYICDQGGEVFRVIPVNPTIADEDLNCDGVVNVLDLLMLLDAWGSCPACLEDLNGDGVISVIDLLQLLDAWG
jgi:glucose/arabinose dehydrogenase